MKNKNFAFVFSLVVLSALAVSIIKTGITLAQPSIGSDSNRILPVPPTPQDDGFIQFNNLTVENVSSESPPAEILAIQEQPPYALMDRGAVKSVLPAPTASEAKCFRFLNPENAAGSATTCPLPIALPQTPTSTAATTTPPQSGRTPTIYPAPPLPPVITYRIMISYDTRLFLRDRTPAALTDFSRGDKINIFGFYNSNGNVDALMVRNLSKPLQKHFVQLNNVELVSVADENIPTYLVAVQRPIYPCYDFGIRGETKRILPCPLGVKSLKDNPLSQGVELPQRFMPEQALRKYIVKVDEQTVILNRLRSRLDISELIIGDKLNIYGETDDSGEIIEADIIRDLSKPVVSLNYSGTIMQVNADGSFVIQTEDGELLTVENPIKVGATVKLVGVLNDIKKIISQISEILIKKNESASTQ